MLLCGVLKNWLWKCREEGRGGAGTGQLQKGAGLELCPDLLGAVGPATAPFGGGQSHADGYVGGGGEWGTGGSSGALLELPAFKALPGLEVVDILMTRNWRKHPGSQTELPAEEGSPGGAVLTCPAGQALSLP